VFGFKLQHRPEFISAPLIVSIISIYKSALSLSVVVAGIFLGAALFYAEKYYGEKLGIPYSFWQMEKNPAAVSELKKTGQFSRNRIFLLINVFFMVALAALGIFGNRPDVRIVSTIGGVSLLFFLLLDFHSEYILKRPDR
jgi:hypothetical protein